MKTNSPHAQKNKKMLTNENTKEASLMNALDAVADLFSTVGLKPGSGKIWAALYISDTPLSAEQLKKKLKMSSGAVSMALNELMNIEIVQRGAKQNNRSFYYRAETEIWVIVKKIFKERARVQISKPIEQLKISFEHLNSLGINPKEVEQLGHLVKLGGFALDLLDAFMERTRVELKAAQKWLSVSDKLGGEPLSRLRKKINLSKD